LWGLGLECFHQGNRFEYPSFNQAVPPPGVSPTFKVNVASSILQTNQNLWLTQKVLKGGRRLKPLVRCTELAEVSSFLRALKRRGFPTSRILLMNDHFTNAIELLIQVTESLQNFVNHPDEEQTPRETVDKAKVSLHRALAELSAAISPPLPENLPPELLTKAHSLGIPLDDIEVRVAITTHHPSQLVAILNEIEQRFTEIRRVREYLLVRLPDMPIEQLGSRLPLYTAADFAWDEPKLSPAELAKLKEKHQIDRLLAQPPRHSLDLFSEIQKANRDWEKYKNNEQ
jgi:hypothetical protein